MTRPRMDDNDKARFLEATMPEEERARAVAHLSTSDEDAEDVGDAAYLLRELEAEQGVPVGNAIEDTDDVDPVIASSVPAGVDAAGGDPKVIPLRPPSTQRARRRVPAQWLALAAVLAGVLLVLPSALRRGGDVRNPLQLAGLGENYDSLPTGWADRERWSRTRGGTGVVAEDDARDAQLGALLLNLHLAVKGRQIEETQSVTRQINNILDNVPGGGPLVAPYEQIEAQAGAPPEALAQAMEDGYENVASLVDEEYFAAGAWVEAAQIAAAAQDEAFFRTPDTRRQLDGIARLTMPDDGHTAAREVRAAAEGNAPLAWEALSDALQRLGRELWN